MPGIWEAIGDDLDAVRARALPLYGATLYEFPTPLHPAAFALYAEKESGFRRWVKTPPQGPNKEWREVSFVQLVAASKGRDEVRTPNGDPFDPRAAIWLGQHAFDVAREQLADDLRSTGWGELDELPAVEASALMMAIRSVGRRCVAGLLRRARIAPCSPGPLDAILWWNARPGADCGPFCGVQSHAVVRMRVERVAAIAFRCGELGIGRPTLPIRPCRPRPADLPSCPRDFYARIDAFAAAARRGGDKPTGPWPSGLCI
jgi:hypothetical protein